MIALHDNCLLLDGVRSSGIAFRKQKLGKKFHFEKQDIIDFSNISSTEPFKTAQVKGLGRIVKSVAPCLSKF